MAQAIDRREFAQRLGVALGGVALLQQTRLAAQPAPQHAPRMADNAIELDSNENPYGPSEAACAALAVAGHVACRYPDAAAHQMVATIAAHHQLPTSQVLLGCGSSEILHCAGDAYVTAGKNVVVAEPTYEAVLQYARVLHANPVPVPTNAEHRTDLPAMAKAITPQTGLVYICNPNNPTGNIVTLAEMKTFLAAAPSSTMVLVDEAYFHFADDPNYGSVDSWVNQYPNLIVARTFSKIFGMAGMRLGYALAQPQVIAELRRYQLMFNGNVAVLRAGAASLDDTAHVAQQKQQFIDTKKWLYAELERDHRRYIPSQTNFVMIDLGQDVSPTIAAFRQRGILVGRKFPSMGNWLRITVGKPEEMQAFMTGLRQIVPAAA